MVWRMRKCFEDKCGVAGLTVKLLSPLGSEHMHACSTGVFWVNLLQHRWLRHAFSIMLLAQEQLGCGCGCGGVLFCLFVE